jgi:Tfp pilus assembly protein PilN
MRPVNLIPPEDRRGQRAPLRAGSSSYALVGGLLAAVVAVTALVMTGNSVSEKESELAALEAQRDAAVAQAQALSPYAEFASLRQQRQATIQTLAESRFDWERVLRELSLVLPDDVWLIRVTGTASPDAVVEGAEDVLRSSAPGPALSLIGCGASQEAVAGFAAALEDIDGVTRVGIAKSQKPENIVSGASRDDCRTRDFIPRFEITAAFDEAPVSSAAAPAAPAAPAPAPTTTTGEDGGVAAAEGDSAAAESSAATQTGQAQEATNVIPGAAR